MPRVTAAVREQTRRRIVAAALDLFQQHGFDATTTRQIAAAAKIASGTLFNYFSSKEMLAAGVVDEALQQAEADFAAHGNRSETTTEDALPAALFAHVAAELRRLAPHRGLIRPVFEANLPGRAGGESQSAPAAIQQRHVETVHELLLAHCPDVPIAPLADQLYWTLYTGVLTFWCDDPSPHQEDTLALLDQSLRMFADWYVSSRPDSSSAAEEPFDGVPNPTQP